MAGAYKQALVQQVALAMKATGIHDQTNQENVSPDAASHDSCQGAALQLVPPTPVGTAPMQAAAMSVAAKGQQTLAGTWAAPLPAAGMVSSACARHQYATIQ